MRLYVTNDSYPELHDVHSRWQRHVIWWRAFASAARDIRFWLLAVMQVVVFAAAAFAAIHVGDALSSPWRTPARVFALLGAIAVNGLTVLTWGGDLIRPHLRRVSDTARSACPRCGHQLVGHLGGADDHIRCPECAAIVPVVIFDPPHAIPREFRSVGRRGTPPSRMTG